MKGDHGETMARLYDQLDSLDARVAGLDRLLDFEDEADSADECSACRFARDENVVGDTVLVPRWEDYKVCPYHLDCWS